MPYIEPCTCQMYVYIEDVASKAGFAGDGNEFEVVHRILEVARFVETVSDAEDDPGCEMCAANRKLLERAWQVIANEYYDPLDRFSQAAWAKQLLLALQVGMFPTPLLLFLRGLLPL